MPRCWSSLAGSCRRLATPASTWTRFLSLRALGKALQGCSRAVVVVMDTNTYGRSELLGHKVGDIEAEGFWAEFITSLKERVLTGMFLVVSDFQVGITTRSICRQLQGNAAMYFMILIYFSECPDHSRAWSPPRCAPYSPMTQPPQSSAAGMTWQPRWPSASPTPPPSPAWWGHC